MRRKAFVAAATLMLATVPIVAVHATNFAILLGGPQRSDADKARDADRKPAQLVAFAGIRPGMKVAELASGGGYFTRVLSLSVGSTGYVYAFGTRANPAVVAIAQASGNVAMVIGKAGDKLAPEPVDVVWTTQNYHDFKNSKVDDVETAQLINRAAFASLKPGGRLFAVIGDAPVMSARLVTCIGSQSYRSVDLFETCLTPLVNAIQPPRFTF
mgnify:CR=1 FL=1